MPARARIASAATTGRGDDAFVSSWGCAAEERERVVGGAMGDAHVLAALLMMERMRQIELESRNTRTRRYSPAAEGGGASSVGKEHHAGGRILHKRRVVPGAGCHKNVNVSLQSANQRCVQAKLQLAHSPLK